jgi:hypothetical protein
LLLRDAHVRLSCGHLKPVWAQKEAALRALEASKPFFVPVISNGKPAEYEHRVAAAREAATLIREGMEMIARIEPPIQKLIEEQIEEALREESPQYGRALAAQQQNEDWGRCLDRFIDKIQEFTRALGQARNHASSGYGRPANNYSHAAQHDVPSIMDAAVDVDAEIKFANKISEAQARSYFENGFAIRALPKLPESDYSGWAKRTSALPLSETQQQCDQMIERTEKVHQNGIGELKAQAAHARHLKAVELRNFLLTVWERFRAEIAPQVFAGDTDKLVAETESLLLARAQRSVLGRLADMAA